MKKRFGILKKIISFSLVAVTCLSILSPMEVEAKKKTGGKGTYAEGDNIAFGTLDGSIVNWTILTYDDTTKIAYIVARNPLTSRSIQDYKEAINKQYYTTKTTAGYVRWSENYWRGWCNEIFYNQSFTEAERAMIQKTTLSEKDAQNSLMNYYHDTTLDGDYVNSKVKNSLNMNIYNTQTTTSDYIFFISSDDFTNYKDKLKFETNYTWALRTNSYDDPVFGLAVSDSKKLIYKQYYYGTDGIRPAMYVKLEEPEATDSSTTETNSSDKSSTTKDTSSTSTTETAKTTATTTAATTTSTASTTKATTKKKYANNGTNTGNITLPDTSSYEMSPGTTAQVAIDLEYLNSTDKEYTITYKSSDANVFTVDSTGVITATGTGTGVLTAQMKKSNGKVYTMSCRIDVK